MIKHFFSITGMMKPFTASMTTLRRVQKHVRARATSYSSIFLSNSKILRLVESLLAPE